MTDRKRLDDAAGATQQRRGSDSLMDTTTTSTGTSHIADFSHERPGFPPEHPSGARRRPWVWLIVLAVLGAASYWMYHQYQAAQAAHHAVAMRGFGAVPVSTGVVRAGDIGVYVEGLGAVTPIATDTITGRVQGEIVAIHYREGQMVHKGDPLIDVDPRPYEAQLVQAQGQLARDQATLVQARIDLDRYRAALARNAISQQQVYDQEQLVKQDEGTVKNDQGVVDNAKVNLVYCHITSPINGRVGLRLLDVGNMLQANSTTSLVVVTQLQPITVIFSVAEDYLPEIQRQLRAGHRMIVQAFDRTAETLLETGSLLTIDNEVDPTTGTIKLRAIFANPDSMLFPNQFVNARLLVDTQHNVNLVPTAAIQRNADGPFLYVINPDRTASMVPVKLGTSNADVAAETGVPAGQTIALTGFDKLQDGAKVIIRNGKGEPAEAGNGAAPEKPAGAGKYSASARRSTSSNRSTKTP
jgi:membrane fusion protein, multidrug efflux system